MPLIRTQTTKNLAASQRAKGSSFASAAAWLEGGVRVGMHLLRQAHPWTHLAALFSLHIAGAVLINGFISRRHPARLAALSGLVLGFAVCLWARKRYGQGLSHPWIRLLPVLCYAFFIVAMSHQALHGVRMPVSGDAFHPVVYASLAVFLGWFRIPVLQTRGLASFALWVIGPGVLFAVSDEWHQSWVPGRCSSVSDVFLNLIGLCLGTGVVVFLRWWAPQWNAASHTGPVHEPTTVRVTAKRP